MKKGKAPSPDRIPPEAVKVAVEYLPNWLLDVLSRLLQVQEFPKEWKNAKVILISKKDRLLNLASSFRPLCMLNTLSKLMEAGPH